MSKLTNPTPTPAEWKSATDYALSLGDKMLRASEQEHLDSSVEKAPTQPQHDDGSNH